MKVKQRVKSVHLQDFRLSSEERDFGNKTLGRTGNSQSTINQERKSDNLQIFQLFPPEREGNDPNAHRATTIQQAPRSRANILRHREPRKIKECNTERDEY